MVGVNSFQSTLTLADFEQVSGSIEANFKKILRHKIPKKQVIAWGAGVVTNGVDLRKTLKMLFQEGSTDINGYVRISVTDANEANSIFVKEYLMSDLREGDELGVVSSLAVGEDAFLVIEARTLTGTATINWTNSSVQAPVTKQLINNLPRR